MDRVFWFISYSFSLMITLIPLLDRPDTFPPVRPGESHWKFRTLLKLEPEGQRHSAPVSEIPQDLHSWLDGARPMARLETEDPRVLLKRCHRNVLGLSPAHCHTVSSQALHCGALWRDSSLFMQSAAEQSIWVTNLGVRTEAGKCPDTNHFWSLGTGSHQTTMWYGLENPVFLHKWMECNLTSPVIFSKLHWTAVVTEVLCSSNSETAEPWVRFLHHLHIFCFHTYNYFYFCWSFFLLLSAAIILNDLNM